MRVEAFVALAPGMRGDYGPLNAIVEPTNVSDRNLYTSGAKRRKCRSETIASELFRICCLRYSTTIRFRAISLSTKCIIYQVVLKGRLKSALWMSVAQTRWRR